MMYENIIVDDSTIIYNNYACQPLIIFIFFLLPMTLPRLYIVLYV